MASLVYEREIGLADLDGFLGFPFPQNEHERLRVITSKYGESHDSSEYSDFLLMRQKDPFGELFSEMYFQSSSEFTFLWNLGKFEIQLNPPR